MTIHVHSLWWANESVTLPLLQNIFCPYCFVEGYMTADWELRRQMEDFMVRCPYVDEAGRECRWTGFYYDFWDHHHTFDVAKKRSASEAQNDEDDDEGDDISPAAKRPTTSEHAN